MSNKPNRTILITGGAGFVGHHMVEHIYRNTKDKLIIIDSLTYSGTLDRLRDIASNVLLDHDRVKYFCFDFRNSAEPNLIKELKGVTHILHLGAESHVDNSITDPMKFVNANVVGTTNMLNLARELPNLELFVYFGTDEVFGPAPMGELELPAGEKPDGNYRILTQDGNYTKDGKCSFEFKGYLENDLHSPKNPYAATKSAAEQMVVSFANTYKLPCIITRQMNIFGERQHPEKFIPLCINATIQGGKVNIHANPDKTQAGMRSYIHARNVAAGHLYLLDEQPWLKHPVQHVESYHIVGELEVDNMKLAETIAEYTQIAADQLGIVCEGAEFEMVDFHSSRPGHDLRYALDGSKIKGLGWEPPQTFHSSLLKTINWTLENQKWLT